MIVNICLFLTHSVIRKTPMIMHKIFVSKSILSIYSFSYKALCLCGLIWQVSEISINYFKFDVLKDINVIMPEEAFASERVLNVCFGCHQMLNSDRYIDIAFKRAISDENIYNYLNAQESINPKYSIIERFDIRNRFDIAVNSSSAIANLEHEFKEFIVGPFNCYQIPDNFEANFDEDMLQNVSSMRL